MATKKKKTKKLIPSVYDLSRLIEKIDSSVPTWCGATHDEWADLYNCAYKDDVFTSTHIIDTCPF